MLIYKIAIFWFPVFQHYKVFFLKSFGAVFDKIASKIFFDPWSRVKSRFFLKNSRKSMFKLYAQPCSILKNVLNDSIVVNYII